MARNKPNNLGRKPADSVHRVILITQMEADPFLPTSSTDINGEAEKVGSKQFFILLCWL